MSRKLMILIFIMIIVGCDRQDTNKEIINKSDYSILQSYEYDYRNANNDESYMIFHHALGTNRTVVAFPIKNKNVGYVVIIANPIVSTTVKYMPESDFIVTENVFQKVKSQVSFSKETEKFISAKIR